MNASQGSGGWSGRAERVLAQGCLTYSKSRRYYVSAQPSHVATGMGKHLIGTNGETIFDTVSGLGANLVDCTNSFSLPTELEVEAAEDLLRRIPFERVKFVKTGSEADMAAVRFMRAATGRQGVYRLGYSGWSSEFIGSEKPGLGCPPTDVVSFPDVESLITGLNEAKDIAGVIMEPIQLDPDMKAPLMMIKHRCQTIGALLCFDEVITGFRFPKYTVAQTLNVMPDLMTMGKALGGGYPLGCVMGPASVMDKEGVFVSGTFSGETSALMAAREIMRTVTEDRLRLFWRQSNEFMTKFNYYCAPHVKAVGYGTRMVLKDNCDGDNVAKLMQEAYRRDHILLGPVLFPKLSWDGKDYSRLLTVCEKICRELPTITLEGEKPRPIFKR